MSVRNDVVEFDEEIFDDISLFGDMTNRVEFVRPFPSIASTRILRYKSPENKEAYANTMWAFGGYEAAVIGGGFSGQEGARVSINIDGTTKFEHRLQWSGLNGYIGGADGYQDENQVCIPMYSMPFAASTVITLNVVSGADRRRAYYINLIGELDDGTSVREGVRQIVDGTASTDISVYTVPAGRILEAECIAISMRGIDGLMGRMSMMYNGEPIFSFEMIHGQIDSHLGLVFPLMRMELERGVFGFRFDSFNCGDEYINSTMFVEEEWKFSLPIKGGSVIGACEEKV